MPNGKVHTAACITVSIASASTLLYIGSGVAEAFTCGAGALVGIMLGPDLDVDGGNVSYWYMRHYIGRGSELAWSALWWSYRKVCKHRGIASHAPLLSTIIRLLYIGLWLWPLFWLTGVSLPKFHPLMGWAFIGLVLADSIHWGLDKLDEALGGRL